MSKEQTATGAEPVSYLAFESAQARADRTNKRLALLLAASLVLTGAALVIGRK